MVESLLGAAFIDSGGNLETVKDIMKTLGMYSIMERIVTDDVDVLHPVSRLGIWTAKQVPPKKMRIEMGKKDGNMSCTIFVDDGEVARVEEKFRGAMTRNDVRFAAADIAIRKLEIIKEETPEDVDLIVDDWSTALKEGGPLQYEM